MNFHKIKESRHKNKNKEERLNDETAPSTPNGPFWAVAWSVFSL